jgi:hypothetical protein
MLKSPDLVKVVMRPEIRKRYVASMDFLRGMSFFKNYQNLTSDEILDMIFRGDIDYSISWLDELRSKEEHLREMEERKMKGCTHGQLLKKELENEKNYEVIMKYSDAEIDCDLAVFDAKRLFIEDFELAPIEDMGIALLMKLAKISRGAFNPTEMKEEWRKWHGNPPPKLDDWWKRYKDWSMCGVFFKFRGVEHSVDFYCREDYIAYVPTREINELIKDTEYRYYYPWFGWIEEYVAYLVLTKEEAEELRGRGWKLKKD